MEKNILEVKDLVVRYETEDGIVRAVNSVNLSIGQGAAVGLVGETGAGKTTLAKSILRLIQWPPGRIAEGEILYNGLDLLSLSEEEMCKIRGNDISMIFQDPMTALNPVLTVGKQISEVISAHEQHITQEEADEKMRQILATVGIDPKRAEEYPHQFSGGMKQRVVIAIALSCNPKCLLADEPTTALDVTIQAQVLDMMNDLKKRLGTALVMITHDLGVIASICDTVAVMYAGKIVEYGTLEDIFNHPMHPYTEGLFNSLPRTHQKGAKLKPIPGLMPNPTELPAGCAFAPRCKYATPACEKPLTVRQESGTHWVLCAAYDDPSFHIDMKGGSSRE